MSGAFITFMPIFIGLGLLGLGMLAGFICKDVIYEQEIELLKKEIDKLQSQIDDMQKEIDVAEQGYRSLCDTEKHGVL